MYVKVNCSELIIVLPDYYFNKPYCFCYDLWNTAFIINFRYTKKRWTRYQTPYRTGITLRSRSTAWRGSRRRTCGHTSRKTRQAGTTTTVGGRAGLNSLASGMIGSKSPERIDWKFGSKTWAMDSIMCKTTVICALWRYSGSPKTNAKACASSVNLFFGVISHTNRHVF